VLHFVYEPTPYPTVHFTTDEAVLADYPCYLGKQIACGYYQSRRFLVVPKPIPHGRSVVFPDLPYPHQFWDLVGNFDQSEFVFKFPAEATKIAQKLLSGAKVEADPTRAADLETAWKRVEKDFFKTLKEVIPSYDPSSIKEISCLVSPIGTVGSFQFEKSKNGQASFKITHRQDISASGIAEKILSCFVHMDKPTMGLTDWETREAIVDFLLLKTKLGKVFDFNFQPTVTDLPEVSGNLIQESESYLARLGFPMTPVFTVNREQLTVNGQPIYNTFTPTEKRILTSLVSNKNRLLTYDEIGNLFWGENESLEKFSLLTSDI